MQINDENLKIYSIIGKVHSAISTSKTFDAAVKSGLKVLVDSKLADFAVIWFDNQKDGLFSPYYWICSADVSGEKRDTASSVGECATNGTRVLRNNLSENDDTKKCVPIALASLCVPFDLSKTKGKGCIEFIKRKESEFTDEETDVCELLSTLVAIEINDNAPVIPEEPDKETILKIKDIEKTFTNGDIVSRVLKGINLSVYKGEFLCFLGESGCGKSTLLYIVGGLLSASNGSVTFENRELVGLKSDELTTFRRDNIGFIFQSYNLMNNLTALENIQLIAELVDNPMDPMEALRLVGLESKANNYPSQLSGGQQQRISIARALVKNPKLIFADEPTAALDYETSIEVLSVFEKIIAGGTTLVMVTHNEEISRMANRVVRFKNGRVYETTVNINPAKASELEW